MPRTRNGTLPLSRRKRLSLMLGKMFDRLLNYEQECERYGDQEMIDILQVARISVGESWTRSGSEA